ncbi:Glyoxylase, beta-lactamase superfamily II [Verrucomicrobium sp. GAS474]|uniref:MBL fold metallo-hydrolase n=1 Tax=Verrucomicrobium sp. GAS474 TaxID=1882831 RepID=UPI00087B2C9E|nr:MBL fold metallo-hydrolase [Verrucomicrobium sp. GAS474]SDU20382.1 Glyoxylase, beta-lactamase superfamily II [Verrucomicrobium sp. GAS474]
MSQTPSLIPYTGGALSTNAFLIPGAEKGSWIAFDAPEGLAAEAKRQGWKIEALVLTHGHFDHVWDAGRIEADHGCPVYLHPADRPLVENIDYLTRFGIRERFPLVKTLTDLELPPQGTVPWKVGGRDFTLFHIPGHSPGSIAFYEPTEARIFGGDILFAGAVGRWDFPGGSQSDLLNGIKNHLLPLPDAVVVYPGHGPETTIGDERRDNPYLA